MQIYDELKAKDRELAALQLKLEMKDQEGHKHKLNVEKLKRYVCVAAHEIMTFNYYNLSNSLMNIEVLSLGTFWL